MSTLERIKKQGLSIGITFDIHINNIKHQKGTSECGMYVLYFIISNNSLLYQR